MQDGTAQLRIRRLSNFAANGLPVGFEYFTINKNIRTGSLPLLGGLYSRELYADLWSWVQEQPGYLISETEWQEKFQANNGNVPFYSSGDGSTTFRVPSLKCWVKGANGIEEVGSYLEAGLPNILGQTYIGAEVETNPEYTKGAFHTNLDDSSPQGTLTGSNKGALGFNASLSNPIYGKSEEVTPESVVGLCCVIAFSTISNTGNLDVQTLYNKVIELENKLENSDATPVGTILALLDDEVPEGYLPAEGAEISRTTYADLFNVIGTKFGEGDGSTTFSLPNLVGRFLEGDGVPGTLKEPGLPEISGTFGFSGGSGTRNVAGAFATQSSYNTLSHNSSSGNTSQILSFSAARSNSIYGASTTVQPPAVTVKFIIKY